MSRWGLRAFISSHSFLTHSRCSKQGAARVIKTPVLTIHFATTLSVALLKPFFNHKMRQCCQTSLHHYKGSIPAGGMQPERWSDQNSSARASLTGSFQLCKRGFSQIHTWQSRLSFSGFSLFPWSSVRLECSWLTTFIKTFMQIVQLCLPGEPFVTPFTLLSGSFLCSQVVMTLKYGRWSTVAWRFDRSNCWKTNF